MCIYINLHDSNDYLSCVLKCMWHNVKVVKWYKIFEVKVNFNENELSPKLNTYKLFGYLDLYLILCKL